MITTIRNSLNIGALLCAFFSLSSYADVRLTYDGAQPSVFDIAHGKVLVSYGTMGAMLFEAEKNKIYVFDHAQKLYIDLDQMAQQVAAMKGRMREMFAAQTKGKTQAEVTQMKEAMGGVMASFLSDDKPDAGQVEMTFTGEQDKVGNYACEKVGIVLATGEPKTICVAAASTLGVSEVDAATLHSMMLKMTAIGEQIRQMIGQYAFGFTTDFKEVLVKSYASDAMTLEGIEQLEIDPASMVIPEGYVLSALPEM